MNYIVLEGFSLYLALTLTLLLVLINFASIICAVLADKRLFTVTEQLKHETLKSSLILKANFKLKLKYGLIILFIVEY